MLAILHKGYDNVLCGLLIVMPVCWPYAGYYAYICYFVVSAVSAFPRLSGCCDYNAVGVSAVYISAVDGNHVYPSMSCSCVVGRP